MDIELTKHLDYPTSSNGLTPLIKAAKEGDADTIEILLARGEDVTAVDDQGRTALHWAMAPACSCSTCIENSESCLFLLLRAPGINLSAQDRDGLTPLHLAAENQLELCSKKLIYYGSNIYTYSNAGDQAIKVVAKKIPNVMVFVLNNCLTITEGEKNTEKCHMKVDFRPIVGIENEHQQSFRKNWMNPNKACETDVPNELALLRSLLSSSKYVRSKIYTHPTVAIFLDRKWKRVRRQFLINFFGYLLWLLTYSGYIMYLYLCKCPCPYYTMKGKIENAEDIENATEIDARNQTEVTNGSHDCYMATAPTPEFIFLFFLTCIMGFNEIVKLIITPGLYFKSLLNVLHWALIIMCIGTMMPTFLRKNIIEPELYQLSAITIFLAWALILSQIGKFPSVGQYMEIFGHVLRHFWAFLFTYISLFIAFALAFCILFPGRASYTIFPFSLLKVFVMMIGEMEYQNMFYNDHMDEVSGPLVGHILYALFVIVVAIVLMNLLVGLTVSDIKGLQKEAELSRVSRQIIDMFHLESFWYSKKFPTLIRKYCHKVNSISRDHELEHSRSVTERSHKNSAVEEPLICDKYSFTFLPNDARDTSLPEKLKIAAHELSVKWKAEIQEKCKKKCWFGKYKFKNEVQEEPAQENQDNPLPKV